MKLSVFVITLNEEARLPATLAAVSGIADQIVVVDSGSTDRTVAIAKEAGAEVFHRDWTGYGPQKRFAEDQCRHPWLLNLDADEVVTGALAAEITALKQAAPAPGVYRVRIDNVYPGRSQPRPFANDYNVIRLYHRDIGRYRDHPLFDRVETSAEPRQLTNRIHHFPVVDLHHLVAKENAYSTQQAQRAAKKSLLALRLRLLVEFPTVFLKSLILRRHILGGWDGITFSTVIAFARFLRIAKMIEARRADQDERRPGNARP